MDHIDQPAQAAQPAPPCARRLASRRAVFGGVAGAASVPLLAACGSSGSDGSDASGGSGSSESASAAPAEGIATSDVPVGGGTVLKEQKLVVTQPTEGEFRAFSAVCTHQGCLVSEVTEEGIDCTCHGSIFSSEDGSPISGPADEPLASREVTVEGDTLTIA